MVIIDVMSRHSILWELRRLYYAAFKLCQVKWIEKKESCHLNRWKTYFLWEFSIFPVYAAGYDLLCLYGLRGKK